jgi:hypothetical protein
MLGLLEKMKNWIPPFASEIVAKANQLVVGAIVEVYIVAVLFLCLCLPCQIMVMQ